MLSVFCMNYFIQKEMVTTGGLALTKYQFNVLSMLPHVAAALASLIVGMIITSSSQMEKYIDAVYASNGCYFCKILYRIYLHSTVPF